jgi:SAM-dependent methyltransferase
MQLKTRALVIGMATYVPGLQNLTGRKTGGTVSARYCYSVWMRHLMMLRRSGLPTMFESVVELGPGDTLGIGLAALLSGSERYIALDVVPYAEPAANLQVFEELVSLFRDRAPIPDENEFPPVRPLLPSYAFPDDVFTPQRLSIFLNPDRLNAIRATVESPSPTPNEDARISYVVPWRPGMIEGASIDLVYSQSVLEYPRDLAALYAEMCRWLKPGGIMSHEIDFKSIGLTEDWNGHWTCSDALWQIATGRRRWSINRAPHSAHIEMLENLGCRVVCDERTNRPSGITRVQLAPRFRKLTDDDLTTSSALIQAVKLSPPIAAASSTV